MQKIMQILDPSHENWVLGGIFRDLRMEDSRFYTTPIFLPPPNSIKNFKRWIISKRKASKQPFLFFSSLTVLVNYSKFQQSKRQKIGLWFTHKDGSFTRSEIKALRYCDVVFVHSSAAKNQIRLVNSAVRIIITLGAIKESRFPGPSIFGKGIVWVGTPSQRKNPTLFLEIVRELGEFDFLLLGNGWLKSKFVTDISLLPNLEYREISGPLTSSDFDGNSIILVTSQLEGGPMPLLEGMAAGLTPVYTDCGFAKDLMDFLGQPFTPLDATSNDFIISIREKMANLNLTSSQSQHQMLTQLTFRRLATTVINQFI